VSDFNDRPLVADSIYGARHFDVDSLGRLRGVSHDEVWRPGVNEATCRKGKLVQWSVGGPVSGGRQFGRSAAQQLWTHYNAPTFYVEVGDDPEKADAEPEPVHTVASKDCACGFYAYTDTDLGYSSPGRVVGIIRGTGVATVGARGFRSARAEIVALVDSHLGSVGSARRAYRWLGQVYRNRFWSFTATHITVWAVAFLLGLRVSPWFFAVDAAALAVLATAAFASARMHRCAGPERDRLALVRRNYPDVPRYRSLAAAMRDFPLSTPPAPSPEDDNFWTRSAR
jgi:hypothetical protein